MYHFCWRDARWLADEARQGHILGRLEAALVSVHLLGSPFVHHVLFESFSYLQANISTQLLVALPGHPLTALPISPHTRFVLNEHCLYYFKNAGDSDPRCIIPLQAVEAAQQGTRGK